LSGRTLLVIRLLVAGALGFGAGYAYRTGEVNRWKDHAADLEKEYIQVKEDLKERSSRTQRRNPPGKPPQRLPEVTGDGDGKP